MLAERLTPRGPRVVRGNLVFMHKFPVYDTRSTPQSRLLRVMLVLGGGIGNGWKPLFPLQRVSPCSRLSNAPGMATSSRRRLLPQHWHHLNVSQHVLIGCGRHRAFASTRKRAHHEECATTHPLRGDGPHEPVLRQGLQQTHSCRYLSTVHAQGASVLNIWNLKIFE